MKKTQTVMILFLFLTGLINVFGQTSVEIEKAAKACKPVFLVAYNSSGTETDKAFALADEAKSTFKGSSVVIKMNTTDAANAALVSKYRLTGAPLPVIIVLDKNSSISGGLVLKDATAAKLLELIPTPKTSEIIKALSDGKSVYVVAYKESMSGQKSIMENCAMACSKMDNKTVTIKVDMDDKKEAKLLQSLKCDLNAKEPVTLVINKSGQVIGTHNGITDVNTLVSSAKKAPAGGCCPGGTPAGGCK
jgi:hypothetical protein